MSQEEPILDTIKHIRKVQYFLNVIVRDLLERSRVHDQSKLESPEKVVFDKYTPLLKESTFGSNEYKQFLKEMKVALDHHYKYNDHHPEFKRINEEEWKPIEGFEGDYEISNFGDIKSIDRIKKGDRNPEISIKGKILKPHITPKGYLSIQLSKESKCQNFMVHRLVAYAFIPNPENKPLIIHKNCNKQDNYYRNLEWSTDSENMQQAYGNKLKKPVTKYIVHCKELDITTFGTTKMEEELKKRGYSANTDAINNCLNGKSDRHLGLTFFSYHIERYYPMSDLRFMSLIDLIEMLSDWLAASKRHHDGNIFRSIEINQERFKYTDELKSILLNTAKRLEQIP